MLKSILAYGHIEENPPPLLPILGGIIAVVVIIVLVRKWLEGRKGE